MDAIAIPSGDDLHPGNDNGVELDRLYDKFAVPFAYDNAATVSYAIRTDYSPDGSVVASGSMSYVSGSKGKYQGIIPKTTALTHGVVYIQEVTAVLASGRTGLWQTPRMARRRTA